MIFWQLCLILFLITLQEIFPGSASDSTVFLISPDEYQIKGTFGDHVKVGATLTGDISTFYVSSPSFLSKRRLVFTYVQQVLDNAFGISVDDYLIGKMVFRSRILWGSFHEGFLLRDADIKWLGTNTNRHEHDIDNVFIWLREGWVALDLSKFMGMTKSVNLQIGSIPFEIGRGISFGEAYLEGQGFLGMDASNVIDEFAPAFLLTGELYRDKKQNLDADFYCAIIDNDTSSLKEILEPIYKKRIHHCPDNIRRGFGHLDVVLIWQLRYEAQMKYGIFQVEPYLFYNILPEVNLEFEAQGKSNLVTLGCMIAGNSERLHFNVEWAINKGGLDIYGWDRNKIEPENKDGYVVIANNNVLEDGEHALATESNQEIIEKSPKGQEFNGQPISADLTNSKRRFLNPRHIDYNGAMFVADLAYWVKKDSILFATTCGFASGGNDPIYNTSDRSYAGFLPFQELYTGLWVQTAFGMGGPFVRPLQQDFTVDEPYSTTLDSFSDLKFFGCSLRLDDNERPWTLQLNVLSFWTFCPPKAFDVNQRKTIDQVVPNDLGTEIYLLGVYSFREGFIGYLAYSIFSPGSRFTGELSGTITTPFDVDFENISAPNNNNFNLVYLWNVGFFYYF